MTSSLRLSQKPITKTVALKEADPSGETTVTVRQHTTNDKIKLGDLFSKQTQVFDAATTDLSQVQKDWNGHKAVRQRVFLTLSACNIINDETDASWFTFKDTPRGPVLADEISFNVAWGALPPEISDEIYEAVLTVNDEWNPAPAKKGE